MFTSNRLPMDVLQRLPMYRVATAPLSQATDVNGQLLTAALDDSENLDPAQCINLNRTRFRSFYDPIAEANEEPSDPRQNILRSIQSASLIVATPPFAAAAAAVVASSTSGSATSYKRRIPPPTWKDEAHAEVDRESRKLLDELHALNAEPPPPPAKRVQLTKRKVSFSTPSPPPPPPSPVSDCDFHDEKLSPAEEEEASVFAKPAPSLASFSAVPTAVPQHILDATPPGHLAFYVPQGFNLALLPWKIPRRRFHPYHSVPFRRNVDDPREETFPQSVIPHSAENDPVLREKCEAYIQKVGGGWSSTNHRRLVNEDVLSRMLPDEVLGGHWITFDPRWNDFLDGRPEKYDLNAAVVVESNPFLLPLTVPDMFAHGSFQDARGTYRLIYPDPEWPSAMLPSDRVLRMKKLMEPSLKTGSTCFQIINGCPLKRIRRGRWLYLPRYPKGFDPLHTSSEEDLPSEYRAVTTRKRAAYEASFLRRERQRENRLAVYLRFLQRKREPSASSSTLTDRKPLGSAVPLLGWNKVSRRAAVVQARKSASTLSALKIAAEKTEERGDGVDDDDRAKRVYNCRLCLEDGHSRQTCPFRFCVRCMVGGHTSEWCPREIVDYGWDQYAGLTAKKKKDKPSSMDLAQ